MRQRPIALLAVLIVSLLTVSIVTGCGDGLPPKTKEDIKQMPVQLAAAKKTIADEEAKYKQLKASPDFASLQAYADKEGWDGKYAAATAALNRAQKLFEQDLPAARKGARNKLERAKKVSNELRRIKSAIQEATDAAKYPNLQAQKMRQAKQSLPMTVKNTTGFHQQATTTLGTISQTVSTAQQRYPNKQDDLQGRLGALQGIHEQVAAAAAVVTAEAEKKAPDYLLIARQAEQVEQQTDQLKAQAAKLTDRISQLSTSYTKRLIDMKVEYQVQVGRTSWDDYADWPTEHTHLYKAKPVDESTYEYFADWPDEPIATYGIGWGTDFVLKVHTDQWQKLKINHAESMPRGDDEAEYWVADGTKARYYHKYLIITGVNNQEETGWKEVSEAEFDKYEQAMGMDIVSKPIGMYEEDKVTSPTPPNMAMVGNPEYGQWRQGSDGTSFWEFYGQYMFINALLGNDRYYRSDYDDWHGNYRNRGGYYSSYDGRRSYGTYSSQTQKQYANRTWAKSGEYKARSANAGGKSAPGSVRGAGPKGRGGGPGGGGK